MCRSIEIKLTKRRCRVACFGCQKTERDCGPSLTNAHYIAIYTVLQQRVFRFLAESANRRCDCFGRVISENRLIVKRLRDEDNSSDSARARYARTQAQLTRVTSDVVCCMTFTLTPVRFLDAFPVGSS